jgi:hypothetical protein
MANGVTRALDANTSYAGDYPTYASDSTSKFINQIWTKKVLRNFYETTVFGDIANTDYEGEIKGQGDKVIIRTTPVITINDYEVGGTLTYEVPEKANKELNIDQAKSWSYRIDDIDALQSDIDLMNKFSADAAERLKIAIDQDVLQYISDKADATNSGATAGAISGNLDFGAATAPISLASDNIVTKIVEAGQALDENNQPQEGRYIILPAWACSLLKIGDLKRADVTGDATGVIRTGLIGMVDNFKIYRSNNIYHVTDTTECFYMPFGTTEAVTFASQLTNTENLKIQDSFGTYFRGLQVYGREVVQPTALGMLYADAA